MEQRDLIKEQIDQLGKVLGIILADFLGLKRDLGGAKGIEITNTRFQAELDLDIEHLLSLEKGELEHFLEEHKIATDHLDVLSEYLMGAGEGLIDEDSEKAAVYLTKSLEVMDILDTTTRSLSFQRVERRSRVKKLLGSSAY